MDDTQTLTLDFLASNCNLTYSIRIFDSADHWSLHQNATPLHVAVLFNLDKTVWLMLKNQIWELDPWNSRLETPLHWTAIFGRPNLLKQLLERGADLEARNATGETPLLTLLKGRGGQFHCSKREPNEVGTIDMVQVSVDAKASVKTKDMLGLGVLYSAASIDLGIERVFYPTTGLASRDPIKEEKLRLLKLLVEAGAEVENKPGTSSIALHQAICKKLNTCVEFLIERGADVNLSDDKGMASLSWAVYEQETIILGILLRHGSDIESTDDEGRTP